MACTWTLGLFLTFVTALRVTYLAVGGLDLSPDETHYWEWSRRLDLAYYSKGPLVAYLVRALTTIAGSSAFAIRLGAVILSVIGSLVVYRLGRVAFGDARVGLLAVVGLQLTPLFWAGSLLMTIDPPFLVAWITALLFAYRALACRDARAWTGFGLALGAGILAKYTMLFVVPGLLVYLWRAPESRVALRQGAFHRGLGLGVALTLPVLAWNAAHGWVSARHVASQGRGPGLGWVHAAEFLGSQLVVLTPLVAGLLGWAVWYAAREGLIRGREPYRFLAAFSLPMVGFYLLVALQGKVQANWTAAAYPPLALVAAGALVERLARLTDRARRRQRWLLAVTAGGALLTTAVGHAPALLGLSPRLDPTARLRGWTELGAAVDALRRQMPAPGRTFVVSDSYQVTSELAFYVPGSPPAYNVNLGRRLNQYDFWDGPSAHLGWDAIFVREARERGAQLDERVKGAFDRVDGPSVVEVWRHGQRLREFAVYRGYGFRGFDTPAGPPTY